MIRVEIVLFKTLIVVVIVSMVIKGVEKLENVLIIILRITNTVPVAVTHVPMDPMIPVNVTKSK